MSHLPYSDVNSWQGDHFRFKTICSRVWRTGNIALPEENKIKKSKVRCRSMGYKCVMNCENIESYKIINTESSCENEVHRVNFQWQVPLQIAHALIAWIHPLVEVARKHRLCHHRNSAGLHRRLRRTHAGKYHHRRSPPFLLTRMHALMRCAVECALLRPDSASFQEGPEQASSPPCVFPHWRRWVKLIVPVLGKNF